MTEILDSLDQLHAWRSQHCDETVVLCHGVFDILHAGHVEHFREAHKYADLLVVSITSDKFVNKGPGRPINTAIDRAGILAALELVDVVFINDSGTSVPVIESLAPDVYAKGSDYADPDRDITEGIRNETAAVEASGGRILFTDAPTRSSSSIINRAGLGLPQEAHEWLQAQKPNLDLSQITEAILAIPTLKVGVVGESIIDSYTTCKVLGKATKHPVMCCEPLDTEQFMGGAIAVAAHCAGLGAETHLFSKAGTEDALVKEFLNENGILDHSVTGAGTRAVHKNRILDAFSGEPMIEIHHGTQDALTMEEEDQLIAALEDQVSKLDVLVVADYGHGLCTPKLADIVSRSDTFLAINVQHNAGNQGVNSIYKYRRANLVSLNDLEASRHFGGHVESFDQRVRSSLQSLGANLGLLTRGKFGLQIFEQGAPLIEFPAFATSVIDRIGAGDALLVTTALMIAAGADTWKAAFAGSLAGSWAVGIVGNSAFLEPSILIKHAEHLLK